jgi:DNA-3-methyladenine glycosylase II
MLAMGFVLQPRGSFSLGAAAEFAAGFPGIEAGRSGGRMTLAFCLDGDWRTVGVALEQRDGAVHGEVTDAALEELAARDVERILSLDVDGEGFAEVEARDPVVADHRRRFGGLRPVLFWTPYEAAVWAIAGQRVRLAQTAALKRRLALELGERVEIAGERVPAFPAPATLAGLPAEVRGLSERKAGQLRALARAALDGRLDRDRLRALGRDRALEQLRELNGVGPFASELIWIRGVGDPDALPGHERRLEAAVRSAYGLAEDAPREEIERIAEGWRPYRSWVVLLLRAGTVT